MAELLHRIRRWLWLLRHPMRRVELLRVHGRCLECGVKLTEDERTYYDMNCERCEAYTLYAGRAAGVQVDVCPHCKAEVGMHHHCPVAGPVWTPQELAAAKKRAAGLAAWMGITPGVPTCGNTPYDEGPFSIEKPLTRCAADRDGDCTHSQCPQLRDGEPAATGRSCPYVSGVPEVQPQQAPSGTLLSWARELLEAMDEFPTGNDTDERVKAQAMGRIAKAKIRIRELIDVADGVKTCPTTGNTCRSNCSERECWMKAKASLTGSGEVPSGVQIGHGPSFDVEAMLRECVPAGSFYGSLKVADAIRAYFAAHGVDLPHGAKR